jgi:hypothetical protein
MTFNWKILRAAQTQQLDNVSVSSPGVELHFETGSIKEAVAVFADEDTELTRIFGGSILAKIDFAEAVAAEETGGEATAEAAPEAPKAKPGRKPKAVEAVAPAPLPVPSAPSAPPSPPTPPPAAPAAPAAADEGIPAFLARTPAPPAPPSPPVAPPVSGPVTAKVVAELTKRATGAPDGGQALVTWLAHPATGGFVVPGASFDEAVAVLHQLGDAKVAGLLGPLGL